MRVSEAVIARVKRYLADSADNAEKAAQAMHADGLGGLRACRCVAAAVQEGAEEVWAYGRAGIRTCVRNIEAAV